MEQIRPLAGIHYAKRPDLDFARVIAPPYDVLREADRAALVARHPNNVVVIDLPHFPPDTAGPDEVYEKSRQTLAAWLSAGILQRDARPAFYPYAQTFDHFGRTVHRRGFIALVRLSPFGGGHVIPHEKTHKGPIEDRLKLMRATGIQLSPIFGLYSDPRNDVTNHLYRNLSRPMLSGTLDSVRSDLWSLSDAETHARVIDLFGGKPVYIADGHHRYTTALQFQAEMAAQHGGKLPEHHPANWCMFVLVAMQDPGLIILATHRLIGGLQGFDIQSFAAACAGKVQVSEVPVAPDQLGHWVKTSFHRQAAHTFGLYDGLARKLYLLELKDPDILKPLEPHRSEAWRKLDVAILQRYLLETVIGPKFAASQPTIAYTADPDAIATLTDGRRHQVALLLQPTPLHALEELGRHGEVMPQKSTFFYPKLATGVVMYPLR